MKTDCSETDFEFQGVGHRKVVARFDAEHISSDGGLPLVREVDKRLGLLAALASCFEDYRRQDLIEHSVEELVSQRVYGTIAGYEDLNDHEQLSRDPLLATVVGKPDVQGQQRRRPEDVGQPLASPSTLNRLELTPADASEASRYKKIVCRPEAIESFFVEAFIKQHPEAPEEIIVDLDATDDPLHGTQEGRFFHGYYKSYCYLPLYIFCGSDLLVAKLRPSNIDGAAGAKEEVERVVQQIRDVWPSVKVVLRADSGFARDELMTWCEVNDVDYVFGLAKNSRLIDMIQDDLATASHRSEETGRPEREFRELTYKTRNSWSATRRVVAKAEHILDKSNPRFVVTTLLESRYDARALYEDLYCARGDMENRIKEQQLALFADRTSAHTMRANQLRLWFASAAYVLMNALRRFGLAGTDLERAQCDTIRTRLIKVGALVTVSVRRVVLRLSAASPVQFNFREVLQNLVERLPMPT